MRTLILKGVIGVCAGAALLSAGAAQASNVSQTQVQAIVQMLQSFGADAQTVQNVYSALMGYSYTYPVQGQQNWCPSLSYNLYYGLYDSQTGGQVSQLQRFLGVTPTGYFGPQTRQAVTNFQQQYGVYPVTGGVGPLTRDMIGRHCGQINPPYQGALSITSVSGPNTLAVGQQGTWAISTNAPSGLSVSVSVRWGDEQYYPYVAAVQAAYVSQQNTFTHSYANPGTYTITFTATDSRGSANTATATVVVGGSAVTGLTAVPSYGQAPLTVQFSSTQASSQNQFILDYGDGSKSGPLSGNCLNNYGGYTGSASYSCTVSAAHTYQNSGTYTATLSPYIACQYTYPRCMIATQNLGSATVTVTSGQTVGGLSITSPTASQVYTRGQAMTISWNYPVTPNSASMVIDLYTAYGSRVGTIAISNNTIGTYTWNIPAYPQNYMCTMQYPNGLCGTSIPSGQYYLKISATKNGFDQNSTVYATAQSGIFTINLQ